MTPLLSTSVAQNINKVQVLFQNISTSHDLTGNCNLKSLNNLLEVGDNLGEKRKQYIWNFSDLSSFVKAIIGTPLFWKKRFEGPFLLPSISVDLAAIFNDKCNKISILSSENDCYVFVIATDM